MAEVARFEDGGDAQIVADFLNHHGVPAKAILSEEATSSFSQRGPYIGGRVVVNLRSEQAAHALFERVRRGDFKSDPSCEAVNRLVLGGQSDQPDWPLLAKATPVVVVGRVVIAICFLPPVLLIAYWVLKAMTP